MNVGQRIREAREDLGMQQTVLARRVGVAPNTIGRYESGERVPPVAMLEKIAKELRTQPAEFLREPGKAGAPPSPEQPSSGGLLEEERRLRYLRPWRAFVHGLARRWEKEPPKTSREIAPLYEALAAVVEQGVFEPPERVGTSEAAELTLLTLGFQRLNEIANNVDEDEERNATVRDIREKFSA